MLKGFKDFLMRGNVVDLAVAVVIGAAFGTVIKAFVDVILSLIGLLGDKPNFNDIKPVACRSARSSPRWLRSSSSPQPSTFLW